MSRPPRLGELRGEAHPVEGRALRDRAGHPRTTMISSAGSGSRSSSTSSLPRMLPESRARAEPAAASAVGRQSVEVGRTRAVQRPPSRSPLRRVAGGPPARPLVARRAPSTVLGTWKPRLLCRQPGPRAWPRVGPATGRWGPRAREDRTAGVEPAGLSARRRGSFGPRWRARGGAASGCPQACRRGPRDDAAGSARKAPSVALGGALRAERAGARRARACGGRRPGRGG